MTAHIKENKQLVSEFNVKKLNSPIKHITKPELKLFPEILKPFPNLKRKYMILVVFDDAVAR